MHIPQVMRISKDLAEALVVAVDAEDVGVWASWRSI
jgi:hypothetical protein